MKVLRTLILAVVLSAVFAGKSKAQSSGERASAGGSQGQVTAQPDLSAALMLGLPDSLPPARLLESPEYRINLLNTGTKELTVTTVTARILQSSLRDALGKESDEIAVEGGNVQTNLSMSNPDHLVKLRLPAPKLGWTTARWSWLTFRPGDYEVEVVASYHFTSVPTLVPFTAKKILKVPLAPDSLAIAIGTVAGCLTLAVTLRVIGTYKFVSEWNAKQTRLAAPLPIPFRILRRMVPALMLESALLFLAGSFAACIAVLLTGVTTDARIVMPIQVHDALGGFTLGFLSLPLIDTIVRFTQSQKDKPSNAQADRSSLPHSVNDGAGKDQPNAEAEGEPILSGDATKIEPAPTPPPPPASS